MPVVSFWNVEDEALRCINSCDIAGAVSGIDAMQYQKDAQVRIKGGKRV